MEREPPNFNVFFSNSTMGKPSMKKPSSVFGSDNQIFSNQSNISNTISQALPETQFPTSQRQVQFYKVKERMTNDLFASRIGYRMRQFSRVEQDYICYLVNLLMTECPYLKVFTIEPNYLYIQMNAMVGDHQMGTISINQTQDVLLQLRIFNFLKNVEESIITPWMNINLRPQALTSPEFSQQEFVQSFQKQVIEKIKQRHEMQLCNFRTKKPQN